MILNSASYTSCISSPRLLKRLVIFLPTFLSMYPTFVSQGKYIHAVSSLLTLSGLSFRKQKSLILMESYIKFCPINSNAFEILKRPLPFKGLKNISISVVCINPSRCEICRYHVIGIYNLSPSLSE